MMLRTTCVISFYYGNSYTHCRKSSAPSFRRCEETRSFYTETLLYRDAFTQRRFYTQTLLHTDAFTQRRFYTHRNFYTQTLFTPQTLYTQRLLHTETLLHTEAFTHRHFYTQTLLLKVCAKVLSRLWSCSGQVSVSRIPIETRRTTKDDEEKKKRAKGFQGFLYGTSGGRNSKGSSPGPPGRKK